jgi:hypothetical protein
MAKVLNLQFKLFVIAAITLTVWGIAVLIPGWIQHPTSLSSPRQSDAFFLVLSFFTAMWSTFFVTNIGFSFRPQPGYELFMQACRNTDHEMHQQAKDVIKLKGFGFITMIGLALGNTWQSGFYLLYAIGVFVYLFSMWRQADLSDRLAQSR